MEWSAEAATREMWAEMDTAVSNEQMRRFFQRHLQAAFEAGLRQEADTWREVVLKQPKTVS